MNSVDNQSINQSIIRSINQQWPAEKVRGCDGPGHPA